MRRSIRVGQRLRRWDGVTGWVALNTQGTRVYGPGEAFKVEWNEAGGLEAEYLTLEQLEPEGVTFRPGVMPWAR